MELGRLEKIDDLRKIWPHEAHDFTKWLAKEQNLELLSQAIDIDLRAEETESAVGNYNVDIFAVEATGSQRKIVIENQLEDTNHDHLGKIITYASGKGAEVVIWIVKRARPEHKQAIEWLNQITSQNYGFFLLEIELWRIGDSQIAPKFNLVEWPNDWAKQMKSSENLSELKLKQLEFWDAFANYASTQQDFSRVFSVRKAQPQHWYDISAGSSKYHISFTVNNWKKCIEASIYIKSKEIFEKLKEHNSKIEEILSTTLEWRTATKDSKIIAHKSGDFLNNHESWASCFDWYSGMALKMKKVLEKYA